jgi:hypothetical protein
MVLSSLSDQRIFKFQLRIAVLAAMCFLLMPTLAHAQKGKTLRASVAGAHSVTLAWTPGVPVAGVSVADASYNVYSLVGPCAPTGFAKVNTAPVLTSSFTDTSAYLVSGATVCYQVTAVSAGGVESAPSNQAAGVI